MWQGLGNYGYIESTHIWSLRNAQDLYVFLLSLSSQFHSVERDLHSVLSSSDSESWASFLYRVRPSITASQ